MIGYATIGTNDLEKATGFYDRIFEALGGRRTFANERMQFYGSKAAPGLLAIARPYDELWWLRKKLRDEKLSIDPPILVLRKELDETTERIGTARSEAEVRRLVAAINERIVYVNSHTFFGPASDLAPLDVERIVAEWRERER